MSTNTAEFNMSGPALLAAAMERTAGGSHTAGAKRARVEIARRDAKRNPVAPVVASSAPVVEAGMVDEAGAADLLAHARKVAGRIAADTAGEVAEPGNIVRTKIRLRKDLLVALDNLGPAEFLATFGS